MSNKSIPVRGYHGFKEGNILTHIITGTSGFVGYSIAKKLLTNGENVIGFDSLTNYYSTDLKRRRTEILQKFNNFKFFSKDINQLSLKDMPNLDIETMIHLAAQPGVRLKAWDYKNYIDNNLSGFLNICKIVESANIPVFLYASSSSVYGNNSRIPFSEAEINLQPESFYGYTKLLNEKIANDYFKEINRTNHVALRFFTVYGEYGRPDMLYFKVLANILSNEKLILFGDGSAQRDFTYIDDVVDSIEILTKRSNLLIEKGLHQINIGGGKPVSMNQMIKKMEYYLKRKVIIDYADPNPKDMKVTKADYTIQEEILKFKPRIGIDEGLERFCRWANEIVSIDELKIWTKK